MGQVHHELAQTQHHLGQVQHELAQSQHHLGQVLEDLHDTQETLHTLRATLQDIYASKGWHALTRFRTLKQQLLGRFF